MVRSNKVTFAELFSDSFVRRHSKYSSLKELFASSGPAIESQADFERIARRELNAFIKKNTTFTSWEEMQNAAAAEWARGKLDV